MRDEGLMPDGGDSPHILVLILVQLQPSNFIFHPFLRNIMDKTEHIISLLHEILANQRELHADVKAMHRRIDDMHWKIDDMYEELRAFHNTLRMVEKRLEEPPRLNIFPN